MRHNFHVRVREKVHALAAQCGSPEVWIADDDIIPETGLLDSAAIIELILWLEQDFGLVIDDDDATVDKLGSITLIVSYVQSRVGA